MDGYASHLTLHVSKLCEMNHIWLYCFKAHATHICQPNDVGPFKPLKTEWKNAVAEWRQRKAEFAPLLEKTLEQLGKESIVAGYRSTGLFPWNVDFERLTTNRQLMNNSEIGLTQCDAGQRTTVTMESNVYTQGYTLTFRYDAMNNIIITQILFDSTFLQSPAIADIEQIQNGSMVQYLLH